MRIVIEMDESEERTVVSKEIRRQIQAADETRRELGPILEETEEDGHDRLVEEIDRIDNDMTRIAEDVAAGRKSPEEAKTRNKDLSQQMEEAVQFSDIPSIVMAHRSGKEAKNTGLPMLSQLLIVDATLRAANGISQCDWIAGVLKGHTGDEQAQAAVLAHIAKLWSEGPWPWPRVSAV